MKKDNIIVLVIAAVAFIGVLGLYAERLSKTAQFNHGSFPASLQTSYISAVVWPPEITTQTGSLSCDTGDLRAIGIFLYCVNEIREGAAGSEYVGYSYTTEHQNKVTDFSFVLRMINCDNYDEPERTVCVAERTAFDPDSFFINLKR